MRPVVRSGAASLAMTFDGFPRRRHPHFDLVHDRHPRLSATARQPSPRPRDREI